MSARLTEAIRTQTLSLSEVLDAVRQELKPTNGKTPTGEASVEAIELELHCVIQRDDTGTIAVRVAKLSDEFKQTHLVRLKLKPDKWPR
jgi:hypothetical protein